jgi:predicted transposase/invertase (TIGR01784 family)
LIDTQVKTLEQAQEKLQQAIELGAHDETNYGRDWINGYGDGELKVKRETAVSMLRDGLPIKTVSKYTGLSVDEIESLKARNQKKKSLH